jgi:site-specific recombinase XerD
LGKSVDYRNLVDSFLPTFEEVTGTSESNLIYHVVAPILENLGYLREWHKLEPRTHAKSRKFMDLYINDKKGNHLVVEVKKDTRDLTRGDLSQLDTYMKDTNCVWGILTNGKEWILVNRMINGNNDNLFGNQNVFHIKLDYRRQGDFNPQKLKYFSYESLFRNNGITNYFRDLQQFKVYQFNGNQRSWNQWNSTLNNLFEYLIIKHDGNYAHIQNFQVEGFFRWCAEKAKTRGKKISSNYAKVRYHLLSTFYNRLHEDGTYPNHPLNTIELNQLLMDLEDIILEPNEVDEIEIHITIKKTFELMDSSRNAIRNKLIFSLMIFGLDRDEIVNITWDDVKEVKGKKYLIIQGQNIRKFPLEHIPKINELISEYEKELKLKGIKSKWFVCKDKGKPLSYEAIDYIVNRAGLKKVSNLSIEKIQQNVIKTLLTETRDVFTILYLRNLNISRIDSLVKWEEIEKFSDLKKMIKKHPFQDIFF